jgi:hypothetical protein
MRCAVVAVFLAGCLAPRAYGRSTITAIAAVGASAFVGFGAGQAVDGEWSTRGWQFAVADSAFAASIVYGVRGFGCISTTHASECDPVAYAALWTGLLGLIGSRLWQICAR